MEGSPMMQGNYLVTFTDGDMSSYSNVSVWESGSWLKFYPFDMQDDDFPLASFNLQLVKSLVELDNEGVPIRNGAL